MRSLLLFPFKLVILAVLFVLKTLDLILVFFFVSPTMALLELKLRIMVFLVRISFTDLLTEKAKLRFLVSMRATFFTFKKVQLEVKKRRSR